MSVAASTDSPREGKMATLTKERIGSVLATQGILIAFVLFMIAFTIANPKFLSVDNVLSVIRSSAGGARREGRMP